MSTLSFKAYCIEQYSNYSGLASPEVYALFLQEGLLQHLDSDYDDLHGMSMEFLMDYFDQFLGKRVR